MVYTNWTMPYAAPSVSGVTAGTLSVPTLNPQDWNILKRQTGLVTYRTIADTSTNLIKGAELSIGTSLLVEPYKTGNGNTRPVPLSAQIPGLQSQKVYCRISQYGECKDALNNVYIAPVRMSITLEVPVGVDTTDANYKEMASLVISALSDAVTSGTVQIMSHVPDIAGGSIEIK